MNKPMTHLDAFTSDDAKRGRVWQDETDDFRRVCNRLERRYRKGGRGWEQSDVQVASFDGVVTWADEPKTLTPQEALRALADGKVLIDKDLLWKLGGDGCIYTKYGSAPWEECPSQSFNDWHVVPDPSQPAEQRRDWNPFGPYEDMPADVQRDIETERGHAKAESRVEYPKSSCSCMGDASCPCRRNK